MAKAQVRRANQTTENRHIVLLDIENIVGSGCPSAVEVSYAHRQLRKVLPDIDSVQLVVACSHKAAATVAFEFSGALLRWQSGPDGADLALEREMCDLRIMRRFGRVTLCSGDGFFVDSLVRLAGYGIHIMIVSVRDRLSRRLRLAAPQAITFLPSE